MMDGTVRSYRAIRMSKLILVLFLVLAITILSESSTDEDPTIQSQKSQTFDCQCDDDICRDDMARIAYLITVHNYRTIEDATPLFQGIRSPFNLIFVHVDTKLDMEVYYNSSLYAEITNCPCGSTVVVVESVHSAKWSTWSMNDPTFWGMKQALKRQGDWDVFINLSGDSLPVYKQNVIGRLFATSLKGMNFITSSSCETGLLPTNAYYFPSWWHKRAHYTTDGNPVLDYVDDDGVARSIEMEVHFGSQWVALLPDFVDYIITSLDRPDSLPSQFRDYLVATGFLMTDETFLTTLLVYVSPFNETLPTVSDDDTLSTLPSLSALRYERMDEHVPTAFGVYPLNQRYEVPESSLADAPKPWGPYFLGIYDLRAIRESGALYIRKVSRFVEPNLYQFLPVEHVDEIPDIYWPDEVQVSVPVDWQAKLDRLKQEYEEEQEEDEAAAL